MAYFNSLQDERFKPLAGSTGPAAPSPVAAATLPPGSAPQPHQAPQSSFVNLQNYLGLNKGIADQLSGKAENYVHSNVDGIQPEAQNLEQSHYQDWKNRFADNTKTTNDAVSVPTEGTLLKPDGQQDYDRLMGVSNSLNLNGLRNSVGENNPAFDALRQRIGSAQQDLQRFDTNSGRQKFLGPTSNRFSAALLGAGNQMAGLGGIVRGAGNNLEAVNSRSAEQTNALRAQGNTLLDQHRRLLQDTANRTRAAQSQNSSNYYEDVNRGLGNATGYREINLDPTHLRIAPGQRTPGPMIRKVNPNTGYRPGNVTF